MNKHVTYLDHVRLNAFVQTIKNQIKGMDDSTDSSSSFQYINAQLVAHGFTQNHGISLDGLSSDNMDSIAKCLIAMLGERVVGHLSHLVCRL